MVNQRMVHVCLPPSVCRPAIATFEACSRRENKDSKPPSSSGRVSVRSLPESRPDKGAAYLLQQLW
jgi:hypothetical protein